MDIRKDILSEEEFYLWSKTTITTKKSDLAHFLSSVIGITKGMTFNQYSNDVKIISLAMDYVEQLDELNKKNKIKLN